MAKKKNTCIQDCAKCRLYWSHECEITNKLGGQKYIQLSLFDFNGNKIIEKCEK